MKGIWPLMVVSLCSACVTRPVTTYHAEGKLRVEIPLSQVAGLFGCTTGYSQDYSNASCRLVPKPLNSSDCPSGYRFDTDKCSVIVPGH